MSILVPDYNYYSGTIASSATTQTFLNSNDESLWSGMAIGKNLNKNHSLGLSLYYTARSLVRSMTDRLIVNASEEILTYEEKSIKTNSLIFILGYLWQPSKHWSWGFSFRAPSIRASGRGSYYRSTTDTANLPSDIVFHQNIQAKTYIPPKLTLGTSWKATPRTQFFWDASIYGGLGYKDMAQDEASDLIEHKVTWNTSFGMEYVFLDPKIHLRAGIFTNNSSHNKPPANNFYRRGESLDLVGLSANVAFYTNKNVQYTVGGFYTGGTGSAVQRTGNQLVAIDKTHHLFSLLIGTSFTF